MFLNEGVWRTWQRRRQIRALRAEISRVRKDVEVVRREIELLKSDDAYLRILAHRDLGYLKEDEIEIRFAPEPSGEKTNPKDGG